MAADVAPRSERASLPAEHPCPRLRAPGRRRAQGLCPGQAQRQPVPRSAGRLCGQGQSRLQSRRHSPAGCAGQSHACAQPACALSRSPSPQRAGSPAHVQRVVHVGVQDGLEVVHAAHQHSSWRQRRRRVRGPAARAALTALRLGTLLAPTAPGLSERLVGAGHAHPREQLVQEPRVLHSRRLWAAVSWGNSSPSALQPPQPRPGSRDGLVPGADTSSPSAPAPGHGGATFDIRHHSVLRPIRGQHHGCQVGPRRVPTQVNASGEREP